MTKIFSVVAFILGAAIVVWMGLGFIDSNLLAFVVTTIIGTVYIIGFMELLRFQRETTGLERALAANDEKVTVLGEWLNRIAPTLHSSVRLRIQGEHIPLPAPILTPYLVGLLVMLGLLGTFAGMVDTLKGAVLALEGTTELEAIRAGLAAPIKGLSLAFGTSVAGVSASAMLGFISTLSRRQRAVASQQLDSQVPTTFQDFSLAYNREQTYKAMQQQAASLPVVAETLATVADRLEYFSRDISKQLLNNQETFHREVGETYTALARSVETSLQKNLEQSVAELKPLVNDIVGSVGQDIRAVQVQSVEMIEQRFSTLAKDFTQTSHDVAQSWQQGVSDYQQNNNDIVEQWLAKQHTQDEQRLNQWQVAFEDITDKAQGHVRKIAQDNQKTSQTVVSDVQQLLSTTEQLIGKLSDNESQWLSRYEARMQDLTTQTSEQLAALRDEEARRGQAAVEQLKSLNTDVAKHLHDLGTGLESPMARLIETASETPRAAAEVISQLRNEISNTVERDNQLLLERQHIFEQLNTVAVTLEQSSNEQRDSIQALTRQSASTLTEMTARFGEQIDGEATRLATAADHFSGSAIELTSLSDAFSLAVEQFSQSNRDVGDVLNHINTSLSSTHERSDEQMAYYVAQAREIIDHTIVSQQEVIEQLRQLSRQPQTTERSA